MLNKTILFSGVILFAYYNLYAFLIWFIHVLSVYLILKIKIPKPEAEPEPKSELPDEKYPDGIFKRMQNLKQYRYK